MYLTQTDFFGKAGPIDPERKLFDFSSPQDRTYPNRWMEDRNLRSLHNSPDMFTSKPRPASLQGTLQDGNSPILNVSNQRYLNIVNQLVQKEHIWKLLKWVNNLSEENKKGLRVAKAVIDIKGTRRFKDTLGGGQKTDQAEHWDINAPGFDATALFEKFRKKQNQTCYRYQFGEPPKAAEDYIIMKQRKLSTLEISTYLQPMSSSFIEKWCQMQNPDEFVKRLYFTLRELHTIIKGQEAANRTSSYFFQGRQGEKVPRFDKMATAALMLQVKPRGGSVQSNRPQGRNAKAALNHLNKSVAKGNSGYGSIIDPKAYKQEFLRGQPYRITEHVELKNPKRTSYMDSMHGQHSKHKARIIDFERTSCAGAGAIPDPGTMGRSFQRIRDFSSDLKMMETREFNFTGDSWNNKDKNYTTSFDNRN